MNRIIGDRKGKSALEEMEEVARERNRDVAEEERLEKLEAARKANGKALSEEPVIIPVSDIGNITSDAEMITGNWDECVSGCRAKSLEVATARQIAELRIKHGKDSEYCTSGCWAGENFNYLPDGRILVASRDYNPHFKYAEEATKAHIASKEFYLDDKIVEGLLKAEKKGCVFLLNRKDVPDKISIDSFGKEPLTAFLGWNKDYGKFLNSCGIKQVSLYVVDEGYADKQKKAFSRALWANNLSYSSALSGDNLLDYINGRVSGVRRRGAKKTMGSGDSQ